MAGLAPRAAAWVLALALLAPPPAVGQDGDSSVPDNEIRLREALLAVSAAGDYDRALQTYREMLADNDVRDDKNLHARVLVAMGEAYRDLDRLEEARESFEACRRLEAGAEGIDQNCASLAREAVLQQGAVRTIPTVWDFEQNTTHGFVLLSTRGTMRRERDNSRDGSAGGVLVWSQDLDADAEFYADLAASVRVDRTIPPTGIRFEARSPGDGTILNLVVVDDLGRLYFSDRRLAGPQAERFDFPFDSLTAQLPSLPELEPARVARVAIRASSASEGRASHRIVLDDVEFY